jgi:hypothetical protein
MKEELIAPCGMNCTVCSGYLALKNDAKSKGVRIPYCAGCRPRGKTCAFLKKRCNLLLNNKVRFCYECEDFPCKSLEGIDTRYRNNYRMSLIENLNFIKNSTVSDFLKKEDEKWRCPRCGGVICCHNGLCFSCSLDKLRSKKKLYRWENT